jgi:hypothetical protein
MSPEEVKMKVAATLDRLNAFGTIATISDALLAVRRIQEKKIVEAFSGLFNDSGLEDLETARQVLSAMFPKPVMPSYTLTEMQASKDLAFKVVPSASVTQPPASVPTARKGKKGGRK